MKMRRRLSVSHHSWSLIDWATNHAETTPSSLLHGLWCCWCCGLLHGFLHSLLHCLHGGHGCKSRVLRVSCRMQSELLLEPTGRNNHTCPIKSCDQKQTHSSNKIKSRQMRTQTCIPASQCLATCRNITLYSGTLIATINVRLLSSHNSDSQA